MAPDFPTVISVMLTCLTQAIAVTSTAIRTTTYTSLFTSAEHSSLAGPPSPTSMHPDACSRDCTREISYDGPGIVWGYISCWSPVEITTTITVATVVEIVNTKVNTTRTTTIVNTEADLTNFTAPSDTNSLGTMTFLVTDVAPDGIGSTTFPVAFPTVYSQYPTQYTFSGSLPTTISGTPTCLGGANKTVLPFPSHPQLPRPVNLTACSGNEEQQASFQEDPRGWTWAPSSTEAYIDADLEKLFPGLAVWSCDAPITPLAPFGVPPGGDDGGAQGYSPTALYFTHTKTIKE